VLISGEPGIGKTRLATEAALAPAPRGPSSSTGAATKDPGLPYRPFVEALGHYVAHASPEALADVCAHGGELVRFLPSLAERIEDMPPPRHSADPETERYLLYGAVVNLLAGADQPVVLVLDDLHWADKASLLLLRQLVTTPTLCACSSWAPTATRS